MICKCNPPSPNPPFGSCQRMNTISVASLLGDQHLRDGTTMIDLKYHYKMCLGELLWHFSELASKRNVAYIKQKNSNRPMQAVHSYTSKKLCSILLNATEHVILRFRSL